MRLGRILTASAAVCFFFCACLIYLCATRLEWVFTLTLFKCIGGCFVDYYVRNIHASAICRLVVGCCNRAAARCCRVLLGKVIF